MSKTSDISTPTRTSKRSELVDEVDSQELQKRLSAIDQVLRMRFRDYSPKKKALEPLNSILDLATLNDVFSKACYEKSFEDFCRAVDQIWNRYETLTEPQRVSPKLVLANVFNNHVATVLGERGAITTQFLKLCVRRISPELAKQLDFRRAKSEPTVFVFGNNVSRICDLLFTIPYKDGRKEVFPIIILMEHKSAPDRNVVKQMLASLVATLDFAERYPERFRTPDGKIIWPFVVLFYTGARPWNKVQNLPDLFTTSLEELDSEWIFKLKFLFVSLIDKRIDVVPTEPNGAPRSENLDQALQNADWLEFFFDLLRISELLTNNPNATRDEWFSDVEKSLALLKKVFDKSKKYDATILDASLSLVNTMCAKKSFDLPTREELVRIMESEGNEGMIRRTWLLSDEERKAAENDGEIRGKQELLSQMIGLRFPKATPAFIKKILKPFSDPYATELMTAALAANSLEEFKKRVQALAPAC